MWLFSLENTYPEDGNIIWMVILLKNHITVKKLMRFKWLSTNNGVHRVFYGRMLSPLFTMFVRTIDVVVIFL